MENINSEKVIIRKSSEQIFLFLSSFQNFTHLMPSQVTGWNATDDYCSFSIIGLTDMDLKIAGKIPYSKLIYVSGEKAPFDFSMHALITDNGDRTSTVQLHMQAELNPMMSILVKRPLESFVNSLAIKLRETIDKK